MTNEFPKHHWFQFRLLLPLIILVQLPTLAEANVGVFSGSGHTIKLIESADIQLQSEAVTIVAHRDYAEFRCKFVLKNRGSDPVTIQVGFPLTSQFLNPPYKKQMMSDATSLVLQYKFIARDQDETYHIRFAPHDNEQKLGSIFLWDMHFGDHQTRELHIAYELPLRCRQIDGHCHQIE